MRVIVVLAFMLFAGCAVSAAHPLHAAERRALAHPSADVVAQVDKLMPGVVALILSTEENALAHGRALTADEISLARSVGVAAPERVRLLEESSMPGMDELALAILIRKLGAYNPRRWGLTARYGIVFKTHPPRFLLAHELRHVAQYEQLGLDGFARRYITELLVVGYVYAPLEADANAAAAPYKGLP
ncbi:MAG TPA: hypothetical protein VGT79_03545 [Xanthomonadaceae bacterium]|nr:hypothetical protein [Xanthomonadaceae bacterium]